MIRQSLDGADEVRNRDRQRDERSNPLGMLLPFKQIDKQNPNVEAFDLRHSRKRDAVDRSTIECNSGHEKIDRGGGPSKALSAAIGSKSKDYGVVTASANGIAASSRAQASAGQDGAAKKRLGLTLRRR
jgi:hypothetical protein